MDMFDKLYEGSDDEVRAEKKPLVREKVLRALAGAADSLAGERIDTQASINDLMRKLAQGDIDAVEALVEAQLELEEIALQLKAVEGIKARLLSGVK